MEEIGWPKARSAVTERRQAQHHCHTCVKLSFLSCYFFFSNPLVMELNIMCFVKIASIQTKQGCNNNNDNNNKFAALNE